MHAPIGQVVVRSGIAAPVTRSRSTALTMRRARQRLASRQRMPSLLLRATNVRLTSRAASEQGSAASPTGAPPAQTRPMMLPPSRSGYARRQARSVGGPGSPYPAIRALVTVAPSRAPIGRHAGSPIGRLPPDLTVPASRAGRRPHDPPPCDPCGRATPWRRSRGATGPHAGPGARRSPRRMFHDLMVAPSGAATARSRAEPTSRGAGPSGASAGTLVGGPDSTLRYTLGPVRAVRPFERVQRPSGARCPRS